jgi:hypothetical protein
MSKRAEELILLGLQDEDPDVRLESARIIARHEGSLTEAQFEMLSQLAQHEQEPEVQSAAVRALAAHPNDDSMDILEKVVSSNSTPRGIADMVTRARTAYREHQRATQRSAYEVAFARPTESGGARRAYRMGPKEKRDMMRYGLAFAAVLGAFFFSVSIVQGGEPSDHSESAYAGESVACSICGLVHTEMTEDAKCKVCGGTLVPRSPEEILAGPAREARNRYAPNRLGM